MATIQILGTGCSKCSHLQKNAEQAVKDLDRNDTVEKISDIVRILDFSPSALPALAIDGKVVTSGMLLTPGQIQEFIKAHAAMEDHRHHQFGDRYLSDITACVSSGRLV